MEAQATTPDPVLENARRAVTQAKHQIEQTETLLVELNKQLTDANSAVRQSEPKAVKTTPEHVHKKK